MSKITVVDSYEIHIEGCISMLNTQGKPLEAGILLTSPKSGLKWQVLRQLEMQDLSNPMSSAVKAPNNPLDMLEQDPSLAALSNALAKQGIFEFHLFPVEHEAMPAKGDELEVSIPVDWT